jgi:hypothetical protein
MYICYNMYIYIYIYIWIGLNRGSGGKDGSEGGFGGSQNVISVVQGCVVQCASNIERLSLDLSRDLRGHMDVDLDIEYMIRKENEEV